MKPEDFNYVVKNNLCLFQRGMLSQWWGGFKDQSGGFKVPTIDLYRWYIQDYSNPENDNESLLDNIHREFKHLYFNCCEQWMMACKAIIFNDPKTFKLILDETSPAKQKALGRNVSNYNDDHWNHYKKDVVYTGNAYKFEQNEDCQEFLKSFNYHTIFAEAVTFDKIWGTGLDKDDPASLDIYNWPGQNLLGRIIGEVRRDID